MSPCDYDKTMQLALQLLGKRAYTVAGLRSKLAKRCEDPEVLQLVIARVQEMGYLSDARFASDLARARLRERPMGRRQLARELDRKQVPAEVAEQALDDACTEENEQEAIQRAVARWTRVRGLPQTPRDRKRLFDHLARRGFDFAAIRDAIAGAGADEPDS